MKYLLYVVFTLSITFYLVADNEQKLQDDLGEVLELTSCQSVVDQQEEPVKNHVGKKPKGGQAKSVAKQEALQGKQDQRAKSNLEIVRQETGLTIKIPKHPKIEDRDTPPVPKAASKPSISFASYLGKRGVEL